MRAATQNRGLHIRVWASFFSLAEICWGIKKATPFCSPLPLVILRLSGLLCVRWGFEMLCSLLFPSLDTHFCWCKALSLQCYGEQRTISYYGQPSAICWNFHFQTAKLHVKVNLKYFNKEQFLKFEMQWINRTLHLSFRTRLVSLPWYQEKANTI